MNARVFGGAVIVAVLSLAMPAIAQDRGHQAGGGGDSGGARNSGGGGGAGTAVSRGDGGGYAGGGGAGSVSGGGSGFPTGMMTPGTPGGVSSSGDTGIPAPSPMGGTRDMVGARGRPGAAGRAMMRNEFAADPMDRAIPGGSRPNYGHPSVGTAIERPKPPTPGSGGGSAPPYEVTYSPYEDCSAKGQCYGSGIYSYYYGYYGWNYGLSPYYYQRPYYPWLYFDASFDPLAIYGYGAYGLGGLYFDPVWFGSGSSFGYFSAGGSSSPSGPPQGGLKLKVTPEEAEVLVDGVRRGKVLQFNSAFERLNLTMGKHHVELSAPGYQSLNFDVVIEPRDTVTYRGTMQHLQPGK